jgi:hypothetical protein
MDDDMLTPLEEMALLIVAMYDESDWDWDEDKATVFATDFEQLVAMACVHIPERFK